MVVCPKKPKKESVNIGSEFEISLPDEFFLDWQPPPLQSTTIPSTNTSSYDPYIYLPRQDESIPKPRKTLTPQTTIVLTNPSVAQSSATKHDEQGATSSNQEPEIETVSLASAEQNGDAANEVIYAIIKTKVNEIPLTFLIDSGAASSHITERAVTEATIPSQPRSKPLQVIGFGNLQSELINNFCTLTLNGTGGENIKIDFNISKSQIMSWIPGVTSAA